MAHKGKTYKLWWRRDANVTLNNYNFGYAECYRIRQHGLIFSARYAVSQIGQVKAVNLSKDFRRYWESPRFGGFFDNVFWFFDVTSPPDEPPREVRFSIWHGAVISFPLYSVTYHVSPITIPYFGIFLFGVKTVHFISPDITVLPGNFFIDLEAAKYAQYNP